MYSKYERLLVTIACRVAQKPEAQLLNPDNLQPNILVGSSLCITSLFVFLCADASDTQHTETLFAGAGNMLVNVSALYCQLVQSMPFVHDFLLICTRVLSCLHWIRLNINLKVNNGHNNQCFLI